MALCEFEQKKVHRHQVRKVLIQPRVQDLIHGRGTSRHLAIRLNRLQMARSRAQGH